MLKPRFLKMCSLLLVALLLMISVPSPAFSDINESQNVDVPKDEMQGADGENVDRQNGEILNEDVKNQDSSQETDAKEQEQSSGTFVQDEDNKDGNKLQDYQIASVDQAVYSDDEFRQLDILEHKTNRFIVKYKSENSSEHFKNLLQEKIEKAQKIRNNKNKNFDVIITKRKMKEEELLAEIKNKKADSEIEYIQPDYEMAASSNDTYFESQWGVINSGTQKINPFLEQVSETESKEILDKLSALESAYKADANVVPAWDVSQGNGAIVAVLDTGIDITHEDLAQNIWTNANEIPGNGIDDDGNGFIDDLNGWNFCDDTNEVHRADLTYDEWHGTHVAGIIAALKDNGKGIAGVAPSGRILPIKVFKNGIAYTSDIISAINYAEEMGASVVNCSWGTASYNPALKEAIEKSNMLFVCAAGNSHANIDTNPVYPASFDCANIISVASINKESVLSSFSNYGENGVDVAAPGEEIMSTVPDGRYAQCSGTSMAAGFVSGEASLVFSKNEGITANEAKEKITSSSDRLSSLMGKVYRGNKINCNNTMLNLSNDEIIQIECSDSNGDTVPISQGSSDYSLFSVESWASKPSMLSARKDHGVAEVNGKIYVIDGNNSSGLYTVDCYDPPTGTWTKKASMPTRRYGFGIAVLNGKIYVIGGTNGASALNKVECYDPATDTWTTKANMPTARWYLGAAAANGKIYAIGGVTSIYPITKVECYDPATDTWTVKANMLTNRTYFGVAAVNSKIYICGGWTMGGGIQNTVAEYDPVSDIWAAKSNMPTARQNLGVGVANGKVYAIGGTDLNYTTYYSAMEEYDPTTNTWAVRANMPTARAYLGAAEVNGKIYAIGGGNNTNPYLPTVEEYSPSTDDYGNDFNSAALIQAGAGVPGIIDYSGDVDFFKFTPTSSGTYTIGTSGTTDTYGYLYDSSQTQLAYNDDSNGTYNFSIQYSLLANQTYYIEVRHFSNNGTGVYVLKVLKLLSTPGNINTSATTSTITITWNTVTEATGYDIEVDGVIKDNGSGNSFVHSGLTPDVTHKYRVRAKSSTGLSNWSTYIYGLTQGSKWTFRAHMPTAGSDCGITMLNGKIYIIGGYNGSYLSTVQEYDPTTNMWTTKASMPTARAYLGAATVNGKIYAIGGYNGSYLSTVQEYDPITNIWTTKASMPTGRAYLGATTVSGKIYAIGGYNGSYLSTVQEYDPTTNMWTTKASMPTARYKFGTAASNGKAYAIGGYNGSYLSAVEEYDPATNTWAIKASMPTARYSLTATEAGSKIYTVGGYNSSSYINTTEAYDPATDTWISKFGIPIVSGGLGAASANGKIYAIGGYNPTYGYLDAVEEYTINILSNGCTVNCLKDGNFNFVISPTNIKSFIGYSFTIQYNSSELDLVDLSSLTPQQNLATGAISGTDITITQVSPGLIKFTVNKSINSGKSWTGVINIVKFKPKITGQSQITLTTEQ